MAITGESVEESAGHPALAPSVLLATSQALIRHTLTEAIELQGIRVVATAGDVAETVAQAGHRRPEIVLLFDDLESGRILPAAEQIIKQVDAPLIVVVHAVDLEILTRVIDLGARGYVTRAGGMSELCRAIERVAGGGIGVPEFLIAPLIDQLVRYRAAAREGDAVLSQLSPREREVLLLLTDGASSDRIASVLVISKETARKHIQNVLMKMGVRSRLAAVAYVMQGNRRSLLESRVDTAGHQPLRVIEAYPDPR